MGIPKAALLTDYYPDELLTVLDCYSEMQQQKAEEVLADEF